MKKTLLMIFSLCFMVILLTGCCSMAAEKEYNIVLLGDIHYDKMEFHQMPPPNVKISWDKGVCDKNGVYLHRLGTKWMTDSCYTTAYNHPKNVRMWKEDVPSIIERAAACGAENNALYAFQLGDVIHGDCGKLELHKKNLQEALDFMTVRFKSPVLIACGNHDPRGPFGQQAWNEVMLPHFDRAAKNIQRKGTNFYITIGKDIYYFHDAMNPDFDFLQEALQKNKNARYTFFVSHVPLIAMAKNHINEGIGENIGRLLEMLEKRNAIVLSGHTHWISLTQYRNNGHRIDQFIVNSTVRWPKIDPFFDPAKNLSRNNFSKDHGGRVAIWNKHFEGKTVSPLNSRGSGHGLLRVSDAGVYVDYYNFKQDKVYTYQLR